MSTLTLAEPLSEALQMIEPISLDGVQAVAELQTRMDRKYLLPVGVFESLLSELASSFRVLEIDGMRTFGYRSIYFDTPELTFFHQHLQRRRHRYKVRTRVYLDSGVTMLEVKSKGHRGLTIKDRTPHPLVDCERLGQGENFVATSIGGTSLVHSLRPVLETRYRRSTLLHEASGSRVTCDAGLVCAVNGRERGGRADEVLVETKSLTGAGPADRWLRASGIRPHTVSKYCVGISLLYPGVASNPWRRTLRRHFE